MYRILYIGYWNLDDPLTQSTIFPNLKILKNLELVESIHFLNTQREIPSSKSQELLEELGIPYKSLFSKGYKPNLLNKISDFLLFPKQIRKYCQENNFNLIIGRGAPAGVLAHKVSEVLHIPFIVESFEPHSEYMKFSGTWSKYDPRYIFQKKWENQIKSSSKKLITVSRNYKNQLCLEGINPEKIEVVPCAVDPNLFFPDTKIKETMRKALNIPQNANVGVYTGKFGNLYHDKEAFKLFKEAYEQFENFYLLLLSNETDEFILKRLKEFRIPIDRLIKRFVKHNEIPNYLNAADFAFAPIKNIDVSRFQSPVKIGEYWACGLPILLTKGVGDESDFIESQKGGLLLKNYNPDTLKEVIYKLKLILNSNINKQYYKDLSLKYRNFDEIEITYKKILSDE